MKHIIRTLFLLSSILLSFNVIAQEVPDFSARYSVNVKGLPAGELQRRLSTDEQGVRTFYSRTQAKGLFAFFKPDLVEETSVWTWHNQHVRPLRYLYQRSGGKKDKKHQLSFNWQSNKIHSNNNQSMTMQELTPHTLDKLVYQLALMADLKNNHHPLRYLIADGNKTKTYDIEQLGEEVINTPLGKIKTIKLLRKRSSEKSRQTTLWCAPALSYLPIKLEHTEKSSTFTATLNNIEGIHLDTGLPRLH